jgi:hypothetical protein
MEYQPITEEAAQEIIYILSELNARHQEATSFYMFGIGLATGLLVALIFAVCWRAR